MIHLGAHEVATSRLYAVSRLSGVVGILWALLMGCVILAGGGKRMTPPAYGPLLEFAASYRVVGAAILLGGILGFLGLALEIRPLSIAACIICALWCAFFGGFLIAANFQVDKGGNLIGLFALHSLTVYILRFWLLIVTPRPGEAVRLR